MKFNLHSLYCKYFTHQKLFPHRISVERGTDTKTMAQRNVFGCGARSSVSQLCCGFVSSHFAVNQVFENETQEKNCVCNEVQFWNISKVEACPPWTWSNKINSGMFSYVTVTNSAFSSWAVAPVVLSFNPFLPSQRNAGRCWVWVPVWLSRSKVNVMLSLFKPSLTSKNFSACLLISDLEFGTILSQNAVGSLQKWLHAKLSALSLRSWECIGGACSDSVCAFASQQKVEIGECRCLLVQGGLALAAAPSAPHNLHRQAGNCREDLKYCSQSMADWNSWLFYVILALGETFCLRHEKLKWFYPRKDVSTAMFPTSMQFIEPQTGLGQKDLKAHKVPTSCHGVLHNVSFTGSSSPKPFMCSIKGTWQRFLVLDEDTRERHRSVKQLVLSIGGNKKYKTR